MNDSRGHDVDVINARIPHWLSDVLASGEFAIDVASVLPSFAISLLVFLEDKFRKPAGQLLCCSCPERGDRSG